MRVTGSLVLLIALSTIVAIGCGRRRGGGGRTPPPPADAGGGRDSGGGGDCTTDGCAGGFVCNPITGSCEPEAIDCTVTGCPAGQTCNTATRACETDIPTDCTIDGCPVGQICNSSTGACTTASCPTDIVDRAFGGCDNATISCVTSGGDPGTCIDGDSDPVTCNNCINQNVFNCANAMGCQTSWDQVACCNIAFCGGPPLDTACIEGPCVGQWTAYFDDCLGTLGAGVCSSAFTDCDSGF